MLIYNKKIIASKIVYCRNIWSQGTGLTFRTRDAVKDTARIFEFNLPMRIPVTMLFVFYPIDIMFLDEENAIVETVIGLKPFRNYTSKHSVKKFVELESGTIRKYNMKLGEKIFFSKK
jgi:uncharacterized membrane protein (UPF0127 family)